MSVNIASFGEIVWDIFPDGEYLGGAPLNFAYFCKKLGANSSVISALGYDDFGTRALERAKKEGIDTLSISQIPELPTGKVLVTMNPDNSHSFEICSPSAWDNIKLNDHAQNLLPNLDAFCFGTLSQRNMISRETLYLAFRLLPQNCLKVFDANLRQNFYTKQILENSLKSSDVLKINEDELEVLTQFFNLGEYENAEDYVDSLCDKFNLRYVILTLGAQGYLIFADGDFIRGESHEVKLADTVGAGDSFTATFITNLLQGKSAEESADKANEIASIVCSRHGAMCL